MDNISTKYKIENQITEILFNTKADFIPKVSVLVPVYNGERYISECIDSLLAQTLKELEIICIDDGSTDDTLSILKKYAQLDNRIIVVRKNNTGYGHTMNIGLDIAKGKYIGILESDDYVLSDMYFEEYEIAERESLDFIKADFMRFKGNDDNREIIAYNKAVRNNSSYYKTVCPIDDVSCMSGMMNIWSGIYSRDFLQRNNIRFNETAGASYQDNGFYFQTFALAKSMMFIDKAYYMNRRDNPNSSVYSNNKIWCMKNEYDFIEKKLKNKRDIWEKIKEQFLVWKFRNYRFTYENIDNENKLVFLEIFYNEFKEYYNSELYSFLFFENEDKEELEFLLKDKTYYYETTRDDVAHVSVIIPFYNEKDNLKTCLEHVVEQKLKGLEIICVDDGSTDNSHEIVESFRENDSRIVLIHQENSGSGIARNNALKIAKGKYVCFLDADDYYPAPSVLRNLLIAAENNNAKICGGSFSKLENNKVCDIFPNRFEKYTFEKNEMISFSDYQFDYGYHRFIYDKHMLDINEIMFPDFVRYQDPVFMLSAMIAAQEFYAIKQCVYCYRKNDKKIKWTNKKLDDLLHAIMTEMEMAIDNNLEEVYAESVARLNDDYLAAFASFETKDDYNLLSLLVQIQNGLRMDIIKKYRNIGNDYFMLKPLYRLTYGAIAEKKRLIDQKTKVSKENDEKVSAQDKIFEMHKEIIRLKDENIDYQRQLLETRMSLSCRIGLCITFIPRCIKKAFVRTNK